MARAALVMDKLMESVGLNGKAFIPMIIGFGCNVPGIMAARTIEQPKERLLTVLINTINVMLGSITGICIICRCIFC